MKKIFILGFTILCFGISGHAETKIADLDKLVAEGKGIKEADGIYFLPDRVVIYGKEYQKSKYGALFSSRNLEYFLLRDYISTLGVGHVAKLIDKSGNVLLDLKNPGKISQALISDKGIVSLFYGQMGITYVLKIIDKNGSELKKIKAGDSIYGDILESLYENDAQYAKNSEILFILAYFKEKHFVLLGINEIGEVKYFEKVNPSMNAFYDWYVRVYFNPKQQRFLIDSNGIGGAPPMLSYWAIPQKTIFSKKTGKDEVILNASFTDNDDILLRIKNKDGARTVKRLSPDGREKSNKSDVKKMDVMERALSNERPVEVRSLNWGRE